MGTGSEEMMIELNNGECLEVMQRMPDNSVDSIVTDPPYGLKFMGKKWDVSVPSIDIWKECLRVLKPGGHLMAFAGTRTQHRMTVNIEDAGFEIRDMIAWLYGSGFPKSHNVSKALNKAVGDVSSRNRVTHQGGDGNGIPIQPVEETVSGATHIGWGTALKPALEPITVARKPLTGTVADNVKEYGTGGINIDGCRIEGDKPSVKNTSFLSWRRMEGREDVNPAKQTYNAEEGRWPANVIHDGSDEVISHFPSTKSGTIHKGSPTSSDMKSDDDHKRKTGRYPQPKGTKGGSVSAARFFYCAKASKKDRGEGNKHPTVKPTDLMRYLCRLVTPIDGTVLDPFMGSGSTGKAAVLEGFSFIGIERDEESYQTAVKRIEKQALEVDSLS